MLEESTRDVQHQPTSEGICHGANTRLEGCEQAIPENSTLKQNLIPISAQNERECITSERESSFAPVALIYVKLIWRATQVTQNENKEQENLEGGREKNKAQQKLKNT